MIRLRLLVGIVGLSSAACSSHQVRRPTDVEHATAIVAEHLPESWTVAMRADGQVPKGHYWGDRDADYKGPRGRHLILVGPAPVQMCWRAAEGTWRQDPIAREALELWLMPGGYAEGFRSRLNPHAPPPAALIFAAGDISVYAAVSEHTVDEGRLKDILARAVETGCRDSEERKLSWTTWREDLRKRLDAGR